MMRRFPAEPKEKLKDMIESLRKEAVSAPWAQVVFRRPPRPPTKGHEPENSPKWAERVEKLKQLLSNSPATPLTSPQLVHKLVHGLGWNRNFALSVIFAAETAKVIKYCHPNWFRVGVDEELWDQELAMFTQAKESGPVMWPQKTPEGAERVEKLKQLLSNSPATPLTTPQLVHKLTLAFGWKENIALGVIFTAGSVIKHRYPNWYLVGVDEDLWDQEIAALIK